ncbi:MAG: hypothetical protein IJE48_00960 [Clostridia bacterium]|nr:hypothetical protein [Clostridia bacterium]
MKLFKKLFKEKEQSAPPVLFPNEPAPPSRKTIPTKLKPPEEKYKLYRLINVCRTPEERVEKIKKFIREVEFLGFKLDYISTTGENESHCGIIAWKEKYDNADNYFSNALEDYRRVREENKGEWDVTWTGSGAHFTHPDGVRLYLGIDKPDCKKNTMYIDLEKIDLNPQVSLDFKRFFIEWDKNNK